MRLLIRSLLTAAGLALPMIGMAAQQLPLEPNRERGQSVTPAFEGWFRNADGTTTLLIGYYNRNSKEPIDVPIGPNNRIEPGGPNMGQPTHFVPRRQFGVFTITVPRDFADKKLTWSLTANGETIAVPLSAHVAYEIAPYRDVAMFNTPPLVKFRPDSDGVTGPPKGIALTLNATVGTPAEFSFWISDKPGRETSVTTRNRGASPVTIALSKFRGAGDVSFDPQSPKVDLLTGGEGRATATFSAPGEYVVRMQVNDASGEGGGGFQCCWTNAHIQVNVKAAQTRQ
jgi:hypothetical protein